MEQGPRAAAEPRDARPAASRAATAAVLLCTRLSPRPFLAPPAASLPSPLSPRCRCTQSPYPRSRCPPALRDPVPLSPRSRCPPGPRVPVPPGPAGASLLPAAPPGGGCASLSAILQLCPIVLPPVARSLPPPGLASSLRSPPSLPPSLPPPSRRRSRPAPRS